MKPDELDLLHRTSLRILEEIGLRIEHDEVTARLLKAGARAGRQAQEVCFPAAMVREQLALVPRTVQLAARNGVMTTLTPDGPSFFWTNPAMRVWTGQECREATAADLAALARLSEQLGNVQGVMGLALADVPPACRDFVGLRIIAANCHKHVRVLCFGPRGAEALVAMKSVFPGPWFSVGFTAHGPLRWTNLALDVFLKTAGHGIPATINGEPMAGVSGPVTLAGCLAVGNAEILAGIVINQILEPGRPVIYNLGLAHIFDMRAATAVTGAPENALLAEASAALGRFYRIPSASWVSTDSVYEDEQAALEKMFGFTTHLASGVNLIWGMGQLESELTMSLGQLVIDNEMINYIRRFQRGFAVSEDDLALSVIRDVGIAGSYLETDHTLQRFQAEFFQPGLLNRRSRTKCPAPLAAVAHEQARTILAGDAHTAIGTAELAELTRVEQHYRRLICGD